MAVVTQTFTNDFQLTQALSDINFNMALLGHASNIAMGFSLLGASETIEIRTTVTQTFDDVTNFVDRQVTFTNIGADLTLPGQLEFILLTPQNVSSVSEPDQMPWLNGQSITLGYTGTVI